MVLPIAEQNPCRTVCALLLLIDLSPFEQYLLPYYQVKFLFVRIAYISKLVKSCNIIVESFVFMG